METHVTAKGQIVIPAELRRKYGIKSGTRIVIIDNGDSITLKPITEQYISSLRGSLRGKGVLKALVEERRLDQEREDNPGRQTPAD
jgi:AbrB family looped-hinge helix DNA binding protein